MDESAPVYHKFKLAKERVVYVVDECNMFEYGNHYYCGSRHSTHANQTAEVFTWCQETNVQETKHMCSLYLASMMVRLVCRGHRVLFEACGPHHRYLIERFVNRAAHLIRQDRWSLPLVPCPSPLTYIFSSIEPVGPLHRLRDPWHTFRRERADEDTNYCYLNLNLAPPTV
jgi:hypothetical protein